MKNKEKHNQKGKKYNSKKWKLKKNTELIKIKAEFGKKKPNKMDLIGSYKLILYSHLWMFTMFVHL